MSRINSITICLLIICGSAFAQAPADAIRIIEGTSRSSEHGLSAGQGWPAQMTAMSWAANSNTTVVVCAVSGSTVQDMIDRYDTCVHPQRPAVTGKDVYLFALDLVSNDIHAGTPPATIMTNIETLWGMAKNDGIKVVGGTSPPNHNDALVLKVNLQKVNQMQRESLTWDYFVDLEEVFPNAGDTALFPDGLHGSALQQKIEARATDSVMMGQPLLTAGAYIQAIDGTMQVESLGIGGAATNGLLTIHGKESLISVESTGNDAAWITAQNFDNGSSALFGIAHGTVANYPFTGVTQGAGVFGSGSSGLPMEIAAAGEVKVRIRADSDFEVVKAGKGVRLWSPNGTVCRVLTIDNSGGLVVAACP